MVLISVQLMGGLGNQLFQIFATLAHAMHYGKRFVFENLQELGNGPPIKRPTYWDTVFKGLKPYLVTPGRVVHNVPVWFEPHPYYAPLPELPTDTALWGYYQSERYFVSEREKIYALLHIPEQIQQVRDSIFADVTKGVTGPIIAVHFRTGTYEMPPYMPQMPMEYYEKGINMITSVTPATSVTAIPPSSPITILCFGEPRDAALVDTKVEWLRAKFKAYTVIKCPDCIPDWQQLYMIACCDHAVIGNSTFSWWGAYLMATATPKDDKHHQVMHPPPDKWLRPGDPCTSLVRTLFPDNWTRVCF